MTPADLGRLDDPTTSSRSTAPDVGWFVGTRPGRALLSTLLAALVFTLIIWNLPDSEMRRVLYPGVSDAVNLLGIDQGWDVFAPNPSSQAVAVEADVMLADGTVVRYTFPDGDPVVGAYREFRWRKFERRVRLDDYEDYWRPTAEWIAAQFAEDDPTEVVLYRVFAVTPDPGSGADRVRETVEFYRLEVTGSAEGSS